MSTLKEVDDTAVNGSDEELPTWGETVGEQTPERRHADALLAFSEEASMKEREPFEYHCYSGWEEAVRGWARVAPMSCILLNDKKYRKPKHKEADNPTLLYAERAIPVADISANIAEHQCESHVSPHNIFKKPMPLNQQTNHETGSWSNAAAELAALNVMQKTMSNLLLKDKTEEVEGTLRETPLQSHYALSKYLEIRPTKPQKHRHRPNNMMVPITNLTFLPPILPAHLNPQKVCGHSCSGKKAPQGETMEENCLMFDKKSGTRGTRVDSIANPELPTYSAALSSKYRTCQHNPYLFSAASVSTQVPASSKPDTVHGTSYSTGKSLTQDLHSSTAAGAQAHTQHSKTV
ncbi:uncharacterized protein LOC115024428 [Cottoperca gobio]|uniref:Uncharacterized protein LOC115024428 n=1 Tax=Cottoperca gobio TaxID=56716 RepID=A0A6J2RQW8_COTGO|nr:uncharacterized protein LOC115024428 [Cottoperca gobio]XP_029311827.1 uncharacterized protein LOC115024428 [Cottoperca gobio]XP_029311835.1 uncharacterized protein LOC115024428 [Cottoperca gobio]